MNQIIIQKNEYSQWLSSSRLFCRCALRQIGVEGVEEDDDLGITRSVNLVRDFSMSLNLETCDWLFLITNSSCNTEL